ncbi:MAG: sulfatase-like hydrolase/transferase [Planctomycetota bacterium]
MVRIFLVLTAIAISSPSIGFAQAPNILIILADDMGYGDLGCMGSENLRTTHMDALANSGVLCKQAYVASPVCSPSRAGLLTGRDPRRFGYEGNLNQSATNYATRPELLGLPPGEHTLGDHLRAAGYATSLIGKWHQGMGDGFHPQQRGFDYFCGMLGGSHGYFPDPEQNKLERNGAPLTEFSSPYLTDFFTDEALAWLGKHKQTQGEQPWFMFLSYNAPHGPMHATEEDLEQFKHLENPKRRIYAAMMLALDRGVGRVKEFLKDTNQLENTLVVFFSDNGGATNNASWNGPLSGCKGCLREGGIRVPMIWSWPAKIPAGQVNNYVMSSLDLLPTFMAAANAEPLPLAEARSHEDKKNRTRAVEKFRAYDGVNLLPQLTGKANPAPRTLFWRLQGQASVRSGDQKLIRLSHRPAQFFNPASDLGEANDLSTTQTQEFNNLFRQLGEWEASLPTVPLWGSSPYWSGQSAKQYDTWLPREEPN